MKQQKEAGISYWAAHLTTIISVSLVLVIVGVIALASIVGAAETRRIKEKIELTAVMADSVSNAYTDSLARVIAARPFANHVETVSKEEALQQWISDTGEDLDALFGVNPLSPEISFTIKAAYASEERIKAVQREVASLPGVEEVAIPDATMIGAMNRNIETISLLLGAVAVALLIISFVLINNTVHLSVYSRRFSIHTMQLVGATNGFIRRPFVCYNMLSGVISGVIASTLLGLAVWFAPEAGFGMMAQILPWWQFGCVAGALILFGALICGLAAAFATNRFLRKNYDELFH